ncbi:MAG: hypothetical protein GWM98_28535, partial [Nitrospinaceae bacterium]|nr:hypothetical protein [Nitrospinaceae bacterium]NIR57678.1 hypothetical protein [Nitrospinaceae bacterium]NIS86224.1 hypothetical protein [Nitrospinaceae bacterium]NIT85020.1 hypothetical protein [Nitrospinaceae bacterium]NIU47189.1 hypothetical protein [Nitrospinaceae bacterium]
MPLFKKFQNIFIIAMVTSLLLFSGCSYIPWIGEDEDDLAFEEDFPFEDEQARQGG